MAEIQSGKSKEPGSVLSSIFFVFIDIFITSEYDLYNKSYFGGE